MLHLIFFSFDNYVVVLGQYGQYISNWQNGRQGSGYVARWPPRQWRPPQQYPQYPQYPKYPQYPQYQQQYRQYRPWWNTKEKLTSGWEPVKVGFGPDPDTIQNPYVDRRPFYRQVKLNRFILSRFVHVKKLI